MIVAIRLGRGQGDDLVHVAVQSLALKRDHVPKANPGADHVHVPKNVHRQENDLDRDQNVLGHVARAVLVQRNVHVRGTEVQDLIDAVHLAEDQSQEINGHVRGTARSPIVTRKKNLNVLGLEVNVLHLEQE